MQRAHLRVGAAFANITQCGTRFQVVEKIPITLTLLGLDGARRSPRAPALAAGGWDAVDVGASGTSW